MIHVIELSLFCSYNPPFALFATSTYQEAEEFIFDESVFLSLHNLCVYCRLATDELNQMSAVT